MSKEGGAAGVVPLTPAGPGPAPTLLCRHPFSPPLVPASAGVELKPGLLEAAVLPYASNH